MAELEDYTKLRDEKTGIEVYLLINTIISVGHMNEFGGLMLFSHLIYEMPCLRP